MRSGRSLLLSCEHGGRRVPAAERQALRGARAALASHRGWDPGALAAARRLARALRAPLVAADTTRLLVDLNRSEHNPAVFSAWTRRLPRERREALLARHHRPHWARVRARLAALPGPVLHVAVHSFTPRWPGAPRGYAVGLLYDPARAAERGLAVRWQQRLRAALPGAGVRRNAPYRGDADGLTTALRRERGPGRYLGIELELNQGWLAAPARRRALVDAVIATLRAELREGGR